MELVKDVKAMCHQGSFNLHKFLSNSKKVIKNVPESDRAEGVKEIDLHLHKLPLERTLGMQWCVESDSFEFNIILQNKPCTRCGILSTVSSVYEPIGFVAPLILQDLCGLSLDWDDPVLGYLSNKSKRFHEYVTNRVQEIQDSTDTKQWRYIESKQNPTDKASHRMKANELQDSRWIVGPEFLWRKEGNW